MSFAARIKRKPTRAVRIGNTVIGDGHPIAVQSMCATRTQDIDATVSQISLLERSGADLIRIAVDGRRDVEALREIRKQTSACLVVDLQESYRLAEQVAPYVQKIRYNPGHLHHHEKHVSVREKVGDLVRVARNHGCAIRIGVNFGSLDPLKQRENQDSISAALDSAGEHVLLMGEFGFENFVVSLKSSDPNNVIDINRRFAERFPTVPLHLGVTEAGMLPLGEVKTRVAFENLLAEGIGDTLRVSLTVPFERKNEEVVLGRRIVEDVLNGRFRSVPRFQHSGLNLISCPSCSRVENEAFVELAERVRELSAFAAQENITIAVMGCRVNGPGETDHADLGLWCGPKYVNLKRGSQLIGAYSYEEILPRLHKELEGLLSARKSNVEASGTAD